MINVRDLSKHRDWQFIENRKTLEMDAVSSKELKSNNSHELSQASKGDMPCTNPAEQ